MTYTKRKHKEAETGGDRSCAASSFENNLKTGWGLRVAKTWLTVWKAPHKERDVYIAHPGDFLP